VAASRAMLMRSAPASASSLNWAFVNGGEDREMGMFEMEWISFVRLSRSLCTAG